MDTAKRDDALAQLKRRFEAYQVSNLVGIGLDDFREHLENLPGQIDPEAEGYSSSELDRQRDLSIKFRWGHNHDFGTFALSGLMGDRHLDILADFVGLFPVSLGNFGGAEVFDIGCWTGGTTLALASVGAKVLSIEEVTKYAGVASFLVQSFGIEYEASVKSASLYNCNHSGIHDRFDVAYCPGLIYHLSDPVLALRIMFNSLKVGGIILIESQGLTDGQSVCAFPGIDYHAAGSREQLDRITWNWFVPSAPALTRMMGAAGFSEIKTNWTRGRLYAYGQKIAQVGICRAGLSVPETK